MSWWVSLNKDNKPVKVELFSEGGNYPIGGQKEAELNITYNYSGSYYQYLDSEESLRWLHQKKAKDCTERLENAVKELGTKQNEDYWKPTKGNAGYALNILLKWAKEYPEAKFQVD